jgi:hypothetical protein
MGVTDAFRQVAVCQELMKGIYVALSDAVTKQKAQ